MPWRRLRRICRRRPPESSARGRFRLISHIASEVRYFTVNSDRYFAGGAAR